MRLYKLMTFIVENKLYNILDFLPTINATLLQLCTFSMSKNINNNNNRFLLTINNYDLFTIENKIAMYIILKYYYIDTLITQC